MNLPPEKPPTFPECRECLAGLARDTAAVAAGEESLRRKAEDAAIQVLETSLNSGLSSPEIANLIQQAISRITGNGDPYRRHKREEMAQARDVWEKIEIKNNIDLATALKLAVLGNSLDYFRPVRQAMDSVRQALAGGFYLHHDDTDILAEKLESGLGLVLYLTDNAGEILFDLPLFEYLERRVERLVLSVKGGPALNDLTRAELEDEGLRGRFREVADTGCNGAGLNWEYLSNEFLELWRGADLVLSKGMANFETMYGRALPSPAFFLFKAKCEPMKNFLRAPRNSYWAMWHDGRR